MTKLDLALINQQGYGRPVPKEIDRHMIKYIIQERMNEVNQAKANNDFRHFTTERWDHSDVFYQVRTKLNQLGWNTDVYNDNTEGGSTRRKKFYDMIKDVCETSYNIKRHQIGIFPADRATMAFNGKYKTVTFDQLTNLMYQGTDVIVVEKFGTVVKMVPFTKDNGIAFIESQGFVSEYGTALARLAAGQTEAAKDYTDGKVPTYYIGHLAVLTDCDSSGIGIGLKIPGATRLGIGLSTISEINEANPGLGLKLEDVVEGTKPNPHWEALDKLLNYEGKLYEDIIKSYSTTTKTTNSDSIEAADKEVMAIRKYLLKEIEFNNNNNNNNNRSLRLRFIDYLMDNRIELNTILAAAGPQAFWNWLKDKLLKVWPSRNYNRDIDLNGYMYTPTMVRFYNWLADKSKDIIEDDIAQARYELSNVKGLIDNIHDKKAEIQDNILNNTLLQDEYIQKLDKALEKIMTMRG